MAHTHHVSWRALAFYGLVSIAVLLTGVYAVSGYFERQSERAILPEPLPKIVIVTSDPSATLPAAWVRILTASGFSPALVPVERFESTDAIIALCQVSSPTQTLRGEVARRMKEGGGLAVLGPMDPSLPLPVKTSPGAGDATFRLAAGVSPLLARLQPGRAFAVRRSDAAFLEETPSASVDARWETSSRAAVAHIDTGAARILWFGFDPDAVVSSGGRDLAVLLRSAFRWTDGQPVSDGAAGALEAARRLDPKAREEARAAGFTFSIERMRGGEQFLLRVRNRGARRIQNPTVQFWFPPRAKAVSLNGSFSLRRGFSLFPAPQDRAIVIVSPDLAPGEERSVRLNVVQ